MKRALIGLCFSVVGFAADEAPPNAVPAGPMRGLDDLALLDDHLWVEAVSGVRQSVATAPAPVQILTDDDLSLSPAVNWADRLRYVTGVDVQQSRHSHYDVGLRGFNSINNQRALITVDGREFGFRTTSAQLWTGYLHLSDISRVEIVKGPSSVTWGANAFGGVIAVSGREPSTTPQRYLHSQVGADGEVDVDGTLVTPIPFPASWPNIDLKVSAGYTAAKDSDGPRGFASEQRSNRVGYTGDDDLRSNRGQMIVGLTLPADFRLEVSYNLYHMREWAMITPFTASSDAGELEEHTFGVKVVSPWGELQHWHTNSHGDWASEYAYYDITRDFYYNQAGFHDQRDVTSLRLNHQIGDHQLSFGAEHRYARSESNIWSWNGWPLARATWSRVGSRTWGAYIQDQWTVSDEWTVSAGVRMDNDSQAGTNVSPRLAINWLIDDRQFARISYSSGYRLPSLIESSLQNYYFASNPDLRAEKVQSLEAGWQYRWPDDGGLFAAGIFASRARDLISFEPFNPIVQQDNWNRWLNVPPYSNNTTPNPNVFVQPGPFFGYTNDDNPVTVYGAEIEARWTFIDIFRGDLELWANATWQHYRHDDPVIFSSPGFYDPYLNQRQIFAFYQDMGRSVNAPPDWKVNMGFTWDHDRWFVGAWGRWVSARKVFSVGSTFWLTRGSLAVQRLSQYMALDLMVGYRLDLGYAGDMMFKLSMLNAADDTHFEHYERLPEDLAIDTAEQYTSEIGRSWALTLDWEF